MKSIFGIFPSGGLEVGCRFESQASKTLHEFSSRVSLTCVACPLSVDYCSTRLEFNLDRLGIAESQRYLLSTPVGSSFDDRRERLKLRS